MSQFITAFVMISEVLHSSGPAGNFWGRVEPRVAEATLVEIWRPNVIEVCQAVFDPVFHVGEGLETKKKVERAFEVALGWYTVVDKNTVLFLGEQQPLKSPAALHPTMKTQISWLQCSMLL